MKSRKESALGGVFPSIFRWVINASVCLTLLGGVGVVRGATVLWKAPNVEVVQGLPYSSLEFENPLAGGEKVLGYFVVDWLDADYAAGPPRWYDDWSVYDAGLTLDGYVTEIWLRASGQYIYTTSRVAGTIVSVHLVGDHNDGIARIKVDGQLMARVNLYASSQTPVAVLVKGLPNTEHQIMVECETRDNAVLGAAVLAERPVKWSQIPQFKTNEWMIWGWDEISLHKTPGYNIAAADWVCTDTNPVVKIRWWGSFSGWRSASVPTNMPAGFAVNFWTDDPAPGPGTFSHPNSVIHSVEIEQYSYEFWGWEWDPRTGDFVACFMFEAELEPGEYFYQADPKATTYWISIAALYSEGSSRENLWGWSTLPRFWSGGPQTGPGPGVLSPDDGGSWVPVIWPGNDVETNQWDFAFELISRRTVGVRICEQPPDLSTDGVDVNMTVIGQEDGFIAADNFVCTSAGRITNIVVWCSWSNDVVSIPLPEIGIAIYSNGVSGSGGGTYDVPGVRLWSAIIPPSAYTIELVSSRLEEWWFTPPFTALFPGDRACFKITIPVSFSHGGSAQDPWVCWLAVQAVLDYPISRRGFLGWKTTSDKPREGIAVWALLPSGGTPRWSRLQYPPGHPNAQNFTDLAFMLEGSTQVEELKWSQTPVMGMPTNLINGWDEMSVYGWEVIVADDWMCAYTNPVVGVRWWGSFMNWKETYLPTNLPSRFVITIWTDEPAGQTPYSHPGECIYLASCTNYSAWFVGWDMDPRGNPGVSDACFVFESELPEHFVQPGPSNIFWISIAADYGPNGPSAHAWGWKTRPRDPNSLAPDAAVRITFPTTPVVGMKFGSGGPICWPYQTNAWDVAFQLITDATSMDFGDAPGPYPTLYREGGAWHYVMPDFKLGKAVDSEFDGQPEASAQGDDLSGTDDEDGLKVQGLRLRVGAPVTVPVLLDSPVGVGQLDGWIDLNRDGQWAADEKVVDNYRLVSGVNGVTFMVPGNAVLGPTFARFRLSSVGGLPPTGGGFDGEVEDYRVVLVQPPPVTNIITARITVTNVVPASAPFVLLTWNAETNVHYRVQYVTNLIGAPALQWIDADIEIIGPTNSFTNAIGTPALFYRIVAPYIE